MISLCYLTHVQPRNFVQDLTPTKKNLDWDKMTNFLIIFFCNSQAYNVMASFQPH